MNSGFCYGGMPFHLDMKSIWPVLFALLLLAAPAAVQAQFAYATNNGVIILTGYNGTAGTVVISNFVNVITNYVFYNRSSLIHLTIPNSVTSLGDLEFFNCQNLASVTIGGGVTNMGEYAFGNCTSLTNATISNGVTFLGENAFDNCTNLAGVAIPASATTIGPMPLKAAPVWAASRFAASRTWGTMRSITAPA